jgi:hypothetical protein
VSRGPLTFNLSRRSQPHTTTTTRVRDPDTARTTDLLVVRAKERAGGVVTPAQPPEARDGRPAAEEGQLRPQRLLPKGHAGRGRRERGWGKELGWLAKHGGDGGEHAPGVVGGVELEDVAPSGPGGREGVYRVEMRVSAS